MTSPTPAFSVCVYCGSRPGADPAFGKAATQVGQWIAAHGGQLVYGGGHNGLMGILADACLAAGGRVVGVIPQNMVEREWAHSGCHELIVVGTMHERKRIMLERADAFVALPGGLGTFEEFFEAWTWRHLGFHGKPVGLLNTSGYYDDLLKFFNRSVAEQFFGEPQMTMMSVGTEVDALLKLLVQNAGFSPQTRTEAL
jgi:uncharacterized protein (TIGR00730 family)